MIALYAEAIEICLNMECNMYGVYLFIFCLLSF